MSEIDEKLKALNESNQRFNEYVEAVEARLKALNESIDKLKSLINKPAAKYKVGDIVWYIYDDKILDFTISEINQTNDLVEYIIYGHSFGLSWRPEKDIFPTREALIKAQIEYWISLLDEDNDLFSDVGCKHENDGHSHVGRYACERKCSKCGEFYK